MVHETSRSARDLGTAYTEDRSGRAKYEVVDTWVDLTLIEQLPNESRYLTPPAGYRCARRIFDLIVASVGLLLGSILFLLIAIAIKLDSPGPVFYRQERVGLHRRPFTIWKFRKMRDDLIAQGPMLTTRHDPRMTRVGHFLERTKLDELPQLFNVFVGHMSVVGPRPEVAKFTVDYPGLWSIVLSVKPGIFGPNQLAHRNESELYPPGVDVETYYRTHILPAKLEVDAAYAQNPRLLKDLELLVKGVLVSIFGSVTARSLETSRLPVSILLVLSTAGVLGMVGVHVLVGVPLSSQLAIDAIWLSVVAKPLGLLLFRVPRSLPGSATAHDFVQVMWAGLASTGFIVFGLFILGHYDLRILVIVLDAALFIAVLLAFELAAQAVCMLSQIEPRHSLGRHLIVTSLWLAPLSIVAAVTIRHGVGIWVTEDAVIYGIFAFIMVAIRPLVTLLAMAAPVGGSPETSFGVTQVVTVTLAGSWIGLVGMLFVGQRSLGRGDVLLEALLFGVGLYVVGRVWRRRLGRSEPSRPVGSKKPILVVGGVVEVSSYLGLIDRLRDKTWVLSGIVTNDPTHRSLSIAGHRVVGEIADLDHILASTRVELVVVLASALERAQVETVRNVVSAHGVSCSVVEQLIGLVPGRQPSEGPAPRELIDAQVKQDVG